MLETDIPERRIYLVELPGACTIDPRRQGNEFAGRMTK